ncbi:LOW QUALITY PROTEIN: zinc finger protein 513a [Aplochiton taeniatus]
MPRKKQQNPQPVKLDSDDGVNPDAPGNLNLETDFLLRNNLEFGDPDSDNKILGLDKFSEVAAEIGFSVYPLDDEESPAYSTLSMESDQEEQQGPTENGGVEQGSVARPEPTFPPYLSCRGCGQLRDDPLGPGIDLVGPYCLRCCKNGREAKGADFGSPFGGFGGIRSGSLLRLDGEREGDKPGEGAPGEEGVAKLQSCPVCGFSSRYANHVKRHMKTHNGEKPYTCPLCTYASAQLVNLQRHLRIHTGEKPYKCDSCTFACSSLGNLKRHQRMHVPSAGAAQEAARAPGDHPAPHPPHPPHHHRLRRPAPVPTGKQEERGGTAQGAPVRSTPSLHVAGPNSGYLSAFDSPRGPPAGPPHPPRRLPPAQLEPPGGGGRGLVLPPLLFPFTCRLCGVILEDEDGTSAQICPKCTLDMLTKDSGPSSPGERGDKVYTCAACPFLTHYPNHLARHMKTHSGEKPYRCPQCEYASAHFDNLKRHHRVHTGEKPYKCQLCDYACGNLANLKRHQRVHSGAKPFQCAVCSYSCNQSMNLKRHMLRHTGEKPYKCQECGYTTGHWDNYKRHQKKHGLATEGWVKVQMPGNEEEEEEEEEEDEEEEELEGMGVRVQPQRKEAGVDMPYMDLKLV